MRGDFAKFLIDFTVENLRNLLREKVGVNPQSSGKVYDRFPTYQLRFVSSRHLRACLFDVQLVGVVDTPFFKPGWEFVLTLFFGFDMLGQFFLGNPLENRLCQQNCQDVSHQFIIDIILYTSI